MAEVKNDMSSNHKVVILVHWDHRVHFESFCNRILLKPVLGGGGGWGMASVAYSLLVMNSQLNRSEHEIFPAH